jgi:hypothetical protein
MVAVAYDANNIVYLLCFAIVEEGMDSIWSSFL